ncbi:SDR family oxidoreductase [Hymenobacter psychrotolerans]|uniref:NAD(P)-dependent dehydrogenase, short-chain alcohol dehydrogenase family n=1 Tax=Hymenobacter psychrotolerans DSM 18569 TaxID=1121959 RepID=A0A1M6WJR7_9BACT|nr:SDR family oxidoreductase [Hymenobacter psychrotolerans]SHK93856.1 NAD(P)-dependent dehydrogenase, short-chain alcohol dehydrogenase family [Hymenobacter psychrotolerans DSM 18569]
MKRVLITGANRGLGLELTRQSLERGDTVFATSRRPEAATELQQLAGQYPGHLTLVQLDVTDEASIRAAHDTVQAATGSLDLLINNAGTYPGMGPEDPENQRLGQFTAEGALQVLRVNAVGPLLVAQAFLDLLRAGTKARILSLSSGQGSLAWKASGDPYHYSASKATLNMYMRALAAEIGQYGVLSVLVDPGWVRTGMGGNQAAQDPAVAAKGILRLADQLHAEENGSFVTWQNQHVPW